MKIGIISDSHDRIENLNKVLELLKQKQVKTLIHCGDFCAPFMMNELSKFDGDVHCVFGNIDDRVMTPNRAKEVGINFHGDIAEIEIAGKRIAAVHIPKIAESLTTSGKYDLVCYGHTHIKDKKKIKDCWLVNPGDLMGWKNKPSFAIYDTEKNDIEFFEVE